MKLPWTPESYEGILLADGLGDAFLGFTHVFGEEQPRAVYSVNRILNILTHRDGMTVDEALEYYEYNIVGAVMGSNTPLYVEEFSKEEVKHNE